MRGAADMEESLATHTRAMGSEPTRTSARPQMPPAFASSSRPMAIG